MPVFWNRNRKPYHLGSEDEPSLLVTSPPQTSSVAQGIDVDSLLVAPQSAHISQQHDGPSSSEPRPNFIRRKTSKWFSKRSSKDSSSVFFSKRVLTVSSGEAFRTTNPSSSTNLLLPPQAEEDRPRQKKAVHFDGSPECIAQDLAFLTFDQTTPQLVGRRSRLFYSLSDSAERPSHTANPDTQSALPIVVRHQSPRSRPALHGLRIPGRHAISRQSNSSSLSSYVYSESPLTHASTGQTSVYSSASPLETQGSVVWRRSPEQDSAGDGRTRDRSRSTPERLRRPIIPSQESSESTALSVTTVESAAAVKVYLETYFSERFSQPNSPRSIRRRRLQTNICRPFLTATEQAELLGQWRQAETDHLRQMRVLKSTSLLRSETKDVSLGDYQNIRVLGKGSFGVVRLVTNPRPGYEGGTRSTESSTSTSVTLRRRSTPAFSCFKDLYAMKVIRKSEMLRNSQEGHLRAERDFLVAAEGSVWIMPLIESFQDNTNLYLVMEYQVGGDFLGYLLREDMLDEDVARWYIAEMILCIEETHKMNWIHRDVKPDNFLISASGHLKITDFGLSFDDHWAHNTAYYNTHRYGLLDHLSITVQGDAQDVQEEISHQQSDARARARYRNNHTQRSRKWMRDADHRSLEELLDWRDQHDRRRIARSVVGTSQYMAPEIVRGEYYDGRCDWWSIGIILYECLYGETPFWSPGREEIKHKIANHDAFLKFPDGPRWSNRSTERRRRLMPVTEPAKDLIKKLLRNKQERLGSARYRHNDSRQARRCPFNQQTPIVNLKYVCPNDADDIKEDPFFDGILWQQMHILPPPWKPRFAGNQSISRYFEQESDIMRDDAQVYMSLKSKIRSTMTEEQIRSALGNHFERWQAEQCEIERIQLGLDSGNEIDRRRQELGADWEEWRSARIFEVRQQYIEQGIDPDALIAAVIDGNGRDKKRARDKMLRDPRVGKQVLELRKKGAFLGYTYRRPKFVFSEVSRQDNPVYMRPTIIPVNH